jgi:hypothetical protein
VTGDDEQEGSMTATATTPTTAPRPYGKGRKVAVALLLVVASILAPLAVISVWTKNTLLDTDQYVDTVGPLARNEAIIDAAARNISDALISSTDVEAKIKDALPPRAQFIAGPVSESLETLIQRVAVRLLSSDQFETVWERANRRAHDQVVDVLTGEGKTVETANGEVVVNLTPVVDRVKKKLNDLGIDVFNDVSAERISPRLVLFQSDELEQAQGLTNLLQKGAVVLPIVTLLLFAAAIALSRARRKTVLHAGLGLAIGMLVILTAFNVGRTFYLDAVKSANRDAAAAVYDQVLNFLRLSARTGFVIGILIAIGAWLAGPTSTATRLRALTKGGADRELATDGFAGWVARSRTGLRIAYVALGAIVLVAWSHPKPITVLVIALIVVILMVVTEVVSRVEPEPTPSA